MKRSNIYNNSLKNVYDIHLVQINRNFGLVVESASFLNLYDNLMQKIRA